MEQTQMTINPQLLQACYGCGAILTAKQEAALKVNGMSKVGIWGVLPYCSACWEKLSPQGKHVFQKKQGVKP